MSSTTHTPSEGLPPPKTHTGLWAWLRSRLFSSPLNILITVLAAWFLLMASPRLALIGMMVLTVWTYWVDHRTWPGSGLGPWMPLRRAFMLGSLFYSAIALAALSL